MPRVGPEVLVEGLLQLVAARQQFLVARGVGADDVCKTVPEFVGVDADTWQHGAVDEFVEGVVDVEACNLCAWGGVFVSHKTPSNPRGQTLRGVGDRRAWGLTTDGHCARGMRPQ